MPLCQRAALQACCQPCTRAQRRPPEALMRSRYCAYKLGLTDYIINTTHPDGPHYQANRAQWKRDIEDFCQTTNFVHLAVLSAVGDFGAVPRDAVRGHARRLVYRTSLFRQHNGRWKYHSGTQTP